MAYCKFSDNLKYLRKQRGLTQKELGLKLNLSKAVISKYENGLGFPTLDLLMQFSEYFNVTTDYLLGVDHNKSIDVTDLTDEQINSLQNVVAEYRKLKEN